MTTLLVSIDDTDNIDSIGTGDIAQIIASIIVEKNLGECSKITRHQLYVHEDIPYTSHNSAMCFEVVTEKRKFLEIIELASSLLLEKSAAGSDPGLCVVDINSLPNNRGLIELGLRAKNEILTKTIVYQFASNNGIHLSEHGGTGQGVIGALAGAALRLSGNDGRFKGRHEIESSEGWLTVRELCGYEDIDEVRSIKGYRLKNSEQVKLGKKIKTVYLDFKAILPVYNSGGSDRIIWETSTRQQLRKY